MTLRLPPLDRSLRDRVREEIRSSPGLAAEYRKRRDRVWNSDCLGFLLNYLFLIGWTVWIDGRTDAVLALYSLMLTGLAFACAFGGFPAARDASGLAALSLFPFRENRFKRSQVLANALWAFAMALPMVFAQSYLANRLPFSPSDAIAIGVCTVAQLLMFHALFQWSSERPLPLLWQGVSTLIGVSVFMSTSMAAGSMSENGGHSWDRHLSDPLLAILPGGWGNAAFYFGHLRGNPAGWLFLAPAGLAIVYLACPLRRPLAVRELRFRANELEAVELDDGRVWHVKAAIRRSQASVYAEWGLDKDEAAQRASPDSESVAERLRRTNARPPGWLDGYVERRLTSRDQAVLEGWSGGTTRYMWHWLASLVIATLAVIAGCLVGAEDSLRFYGICCIGIYCFMATLPADRTGYYSYLLPYGMAEPLRASLKVSLFLSPLWLATTLLGGGIVAGFHNISLGSAFVAATLPILYFPALLSLGMLFFLAKASDFFRKLSFLVAMLGMFALMEYVFGLPRSTSLSELQLHLGGIALLTLLALIAWALAWRAFHRGTVDIVAPGKEGA